MTEEGTKEGKRARSNGVSGGVRSCGVWYELRQPRQEAILNKEKSAGTRISGNPVKQRSDGDGIGERMGGVHGAGNIQDPEGIRNAEGDRVRRDTE